MTQRKLLFGAFSLVVALGLFFFVSDLGNNAQANHLPSPTPSASPSPSVNPSPSPSPSVSAGPTATPTPGPSVSPTPGASPLPSPTPTPNYTATRTGQWGRIWNNRWRGQVANATTPVKAEALPKGVDDKRGCLVERDQKDHENKALIVRNDKWLTSKGISVSTFKGGFTGRNGSYLISQVYTSQQSDSVRWETISSHYYVGYFQDGRIGVYYRVSDDKGTSDVNDSGWVQVKNGELSECDRTVEFKVDKIAKYFQYKLVFTTTAQVEDMSIGFQPVKLTYTSPSPEATSSAAVTTPTPANSGKITIVTQKLIPAQAASPSPSPAGPPLPDITPSPSPVPSSKSSTKPTATASAKPGVTVNPICFSEQETEPAPLVKLTVKQKDGGQTVIEDQQTDEDGEWKGLGGHTDHFTAGTYVINFGDFQKADYKLVALCVTPDDGEHHLKTQTTATGSKATIVVKPNQETKVTALYAPRNKPYISMNKFAITNEGKVVKSLVAGGSLNYLIRIENTGAATARDVEVTDVIPAEYFVVEPESNLDEKVAFTTSLDGRGRTVVSKKIGTMAPGQKASLLIPVVLRPNAFGSPDDVAGTVNQNREILDAEKRAASQEAAGTESGAGDSGGAGGLELR